MNKIKLPLRYDFEGQYIFDAEDKMIAEVRGWGWIQKLKKEDIGKSQSEFQDDLGQLIVSILNKELLDSSYVQQVFIIENVKVNQTRHRRKEMSEIMTYQKARKAFDRSRNKLDKLRKKYGNTFHNFNNILKFENEISLPIKKEMKKYSQLMRKLIPLNNPEIEKNQINESWGEVYDMDSFINNCKDKYLIDSDGFGRYCIDENTETSIDIYPSDIIDGVYREDMPFIIWYNK